MASRAMGWAPVRPPKVLDEPEGIIEIGAVHRDIVHAGVGAAETYPAAGGAGRWFQLGEIRKGTAEGRQLLQLGPPDDLLAAGMRVVEDLILFGAGYYHSCQLF